MTSARSQRFGLFVFGLPVVAHPQLLVSPGVADDRVSAPIADVRYEVRFDRTTAAAGVLDVRMQFRVAGADPVLLSLPAWTPGSYGLEHFARRVLSFAAASGGRALRWDKLDYDTWRVFPGGGGGGGGEGGGEVEVRFEFRADVQDVSAAWAGADFAFFNGTNVFLFPEGRSRDSPSRVIVRTDDDWLVATGLDAGGAPRSYTATSYDELVDRPVFVGAIDLDSTRIDGRWYRLATYPRDALSGRRRRDLWQQIERMLPPQVAVFGETPWEHYTVLMVFDPSFGGGSALEHGNSHLAIYSPALIGTNILASITAHEIFHAWNVKRLRPAELVPYDYSRPQPTPLLWVSEGITDYYADLALVRGGIAPAEEFYLTTSNKITTVAEAPPVALEDASLSTWVNPVDGTATIYYPKGSLAGLALDILIRDGSDNRASLDDVLRELYRTTYRNGRGFTNDDWWQTVARMTGRPLDDWYRRHVDGREPIPWETLLPLAGLSLLADTARIPRLGVFTAVDDSTVRVTRVVPGEAAEAAGVLPGDVIVSVGGVAADDPSWGRRFQARYAGSPAGTALEIVVRREGRTMTLQGELRFDAAVTFRIREDQAAGPKAQRIRRGILEGMTTDR